MSRIRCCQLMLATWIFVYPGIQVASAAPIVVIQLHNGRVLTGNVDSRTSDSELWLHTTEPSIVILCSIAWNDVRTVKIGDKVLPQNDLRRTLQNLKVPIPDDVFRHPTVRSRPMTVPNPKIVSLEIRAKLANWDRDLEPDGLELRVSPLTAEGNSTAVDGLITIGLMGRRLGTSERLEPQSRFGFHSNGGSPREYSPRGQSARYVELGRWSERLKKAEGQPAGYHLLRLPFRTVQPEYDLDVALDGQLDVRLNLKGQQIQTASTPVQLRQFSPFREELQLNRGTRFFPDESIGQ